MLLRAACGLLSESLIDLLLACALQILLGKKKIALELVMQLEYIISNGCTAMTGFNGSILSIRTIQTKVMSEK